MDDSVKTVLTVKAMGIKVFLAMNCFNLDFKDDDITNIYNMDELLEQIKANS